MSEIITRKAIHKNLAKCTRKHKVIFTDATAAEIHACDLMFSGGTKSYFDMLNLKTGQSKPIDYQNLATSPFSGGALAITVEIPDGHALVKSGVFCGKQATLSVFGREDDCLKSQ